MLSRIFWIGIAGIALLTGIVLQDGDRFFRSDRGIDIGMDGAVDRTVDRSVDHLQVVGPEGQQVAVSREDKRALAEAVGRLVKAEADHAVLRIGDASEAEMLAVNARRAQARAEVDRLKAEIKGEEQAADSDAIRAEVRREIRDTVREAVRN